MGMKRFARVLRMNRLDSRLNPQLLAFEGPVKTIDEFLGSGFISVF
jgi:hypothetical protein